MFNPVGGTPNVLSPFPIYPQTSLLTAQQSTLSQCAQTDFFGHPIKKPSLSENKNFGEATIPCFDFSTIERASNLDRPRLIKELGDAWKDYGFIGIKAESIVPHMKNVYDQMAIYFHQSLEMKMKDDHQNFGLTGFSPQGRESAAGTKVPDIKETYFINPDLYMNESKWPTHLPEFRGAMIAYHQELTQVMSKFMEYFFEYLGEEPCNIQETLKTKNNLVRLAYYPAKKETDHPDALAAAPHEDLNFATALLPATAPGLEMIQDGKITPVIVPEGFLIINTGEQAEHKTAGKLKAVTHQVKMPKGTFERFASIYFAAFAPDYSLKPFNSCVVEMTKNMSNSEVALYLKNYPDVTAQEKTDSRLIEMGTIQNPSKEQVADLRSKGLIQKPTDALKEMYSDLFV